MAIVFEIIYHTDRPVLAKIEERYGPLNFKIPEPEYDPIFDDPEFQSMDRLMRQVPRKGRG